MAGGLSREDRKLQAIRCHTTRSTHTHTHTHTHTIWFNPDLWADLCDVLSDDCKSKTMGQVLYEYLRILLRVIRKRNISLIHHILSCKTTRVQYPWPVATVVTVGWFVGRTVTITVSGTPQHQNCVYLLNIYVIYKCGREPRVGYPCASQKCLFSARDCCRLPRQYLNNLYAKNTIQ